MKILTTLLVLFLVGCSTARYRDTSDWDADDNDKLTRNEFVNGYIQDHYFRSWSRAKILSKEKFYNTIFDKLDKNNNASLSHVEFVRPIRYYSTPVAFSLWDTNSNNEVSKTEFNANSNALSLIELWDTSNDQRVSEEELAGGMFKLSDLNNDGMLNSLEFNLWKIYR